MSDPYDFLDTAEDQWPSKDSRFSEKFAFDVMQAAGIMGTAMALRKDGNLSCTSANEYLPEYFYGLYIGSEKVSKPVLLQDLLYHKKLMKTDIWKAWGDLVASYAFPNNAAMAFDKHGDGVPPLVLTSWGSAVSNFSHIILHTTHGDNLYILDYKDFISCVRSYAR